MTELQKVELRLHDVRKRLRELGAESEQTDETRAEMTKLLAEVGTLETREQALKLGEQPTETETETERTDPEGREFRELLAKASIGDVFEAAVEQRASTGATRELQDHLKLASNQVPLELLAGDVEQRAAAEGREVEHRTAGVTPAPADVGQQPRPIIPWVFPQAAVSWLGIMQDRVPTGEAVYTVLSTALAAGTPAKGAEQAHSAAAFTAKVLAPARIQASVFYGREDQARLRGMAEALRMNLSDALADKLDEVVLDNLLTGSTLTANAAGAADTYASYRKRFLYDAIDGIYASEARQCRVLVGSATYGDMAASYRSDSSDMNALGALMAESGGVRVTAHAAAPVSNKQQSVVRRGTRKDYALGVWQGVSLIVDEVTQAKAGEVVLTAVMLYAQDLLRAAGFRKVEAQVA